MLLRLPILITALVALTLSTLAAPVDLSSAESYGIRHVDSATAAQNLSARQFKWAKNLFSKKPPLPPPAPPRPATPAPQLPALTPVGANLNVPQKFLYRPPAGQGSSNPSASHPPPPAPGRVGTVARPNGGGLPALPSRFSDNSSVVAAQKSTWGKVKGAVLAIGRKRP